MKGKKEFDKSIMILIAIILITLITAFSLYLNVRVDKVTQILKDQGVLSAVITVEEDDQVILSQVLVINGETNKGALIDIPNNTGTIIESKKKFSSVASIYNEIGVNSYREKISDILALNIPFHITISRSGFMELIDLLDGLDLFISKSLEDQSHNFSIPSGSVVLEGDKVDQYINLDIKNEHNNAYVARKQKIIQAFLTQIQKYSTQIISENNFPNIYSRIKKTNLDYSSANKFFTLLGDLEVERLVLQGILGEERLVSGERLIFPYNNENLIKIRIKRILINLGNPEVISDEKLNFNIQVLNGSGIQGLANRTQRYLKSFNYTISGYGNASSDNFETTTILVRKGNREGAERLGELINCQYIYSQIEEGIDDTIDFTIILGKDFDGKRVKN